MSIADYCWASRARGLTPPAKLVLILVADGCDQDGRYFGPFEELAEQANVTLAYLDQIVAELTNVSMASYALAINPSNGETLRCIQLFREGLDNGG